MAKNRMEKIASYEEQILKLQEYKIPLLHHALCHAISNTIQAGLHVATFAHGLFTGLQKSNVMNNSNKNGTAVQTYINFSIFFIAV